MPNCSQMAGFIPPVSLGEIPLRQEAAEAGQDRVAPLCPQRREGELAQPVSRVYHGAKAEYVGGTRRVRDDVADIAASVLAGDDRGGRTAHLTQRGGHVEYRDRAPGAD